MKIFFSFSLILLFNLGVYAQDIEEHIFLRPIHVFAGEGIIYTGTMIGLNTLWYKDYAHSEFHWFDDHDEWLQMDKFGHGFSAYYLANISSFLFGKTQWNGTKKDVFYGSLTAWTYISTVEIFDGFSSKWGASYSDLIANTIGVGLYTFQELSFGKQIVVPKFSFHQTSFAGYRADVLGKNFLQNLLKDYNGQTYWLSINFKDAFGSKFFPVWLNFSLGYSSEGLLGGQKNPDDLPYFDRTRQYLFSLDIDFRKIKVKSRFLKQCFRAINVIKIPFPAVILENKQVKFSTFCF